MSETTTSKFVWVALALSLVAIVALAIVFTSGSSETADGPAELPEANEQEGGVPVGDVETTTALVEPTPAKPGQVDPDLTVTDPVPDELVSAFFVMLEDDGYTPLMNETYTVEFRGDTDTVYIQGEFVDGSHEFEFGFADDEWNLVVIS